MDEQELVLFVDRNNYMTKQKDPHAVALGRKGGLKSGGGARPGAGRKPSCHCGTCAVCRRRKARQALKMQPLAV